MESEDFDEPHDISSNLNVDLLEVYKVNKSKGLEVVFAALGNDRARFNDVFFTMPWLAIPHEDRATRDYLCHHFAIQYRIALPRAILVDPAGDVLHSDCEFVFRTYGPEGFPFSQYMGELLTYQDDLMWYELVVQRESISLTKLLGDTIISSEGDKASAFYFQ